jgi:hypothetical protein
MIIAPFFDFYAPRTVPYALCPMLYAYALCLWSSKARFLAAKTNGQTLLAVGLKQFAPILSKTMVILSRLRSQLVQHTHKLGGTHLCYNTKHRFFGVENVWILSVKKWTDGSHNPRFAARKAKNWDTQSQLGGQEDSGFEGKKEVNFKGFPLGGGTCCAFDCNT